MSNVPMTVEDCKRLETRIGACHDAFEGSDIPTERITPGLVGEMIKQLEILSHSRKDVRALLARIKPETDDEA